MNKGKLLISAAAGLSAMGCANAQQTKPNIVFLLFDDLGYGDLGCYGQEKIETPNIDALANHGLLFTDMYTEAPLSSPSRCCLMTGKHMGHSQIRGNKEKVEHADSYWNDVFLDQKIQGQQPMLAGTVTYPKLLQQAGYKTALVGKWGLGDPQSESLPNKMGFDYFYGFVCQALAHTYYPTHLWENDKEIATGNELVLQACKLPEGEDPKDPKNYEKYGGKFYSPDLMYDKLENFIVQNASGPFYAMWTTTVPHSAVQAPADEVQYYVNKLGDEEPITDPGGYLPSRYPHATYAAMVTHIDTQVGRLVKKLKELGVWENTIFVVTSDNGPAHNGNSPMEYFKSGGPFRCHAGWGKSSLREGGIRMPFVLNWGDRLAKCEKVTDMFCFADMMPTFSELAGVKAPENDGLSLVPTITGKGKQTQHDFLYWEYPMTKGWVAVRIGQWKGLLRKASAGNTHMELFNLADDPGEKKDLSAEHPDLIKKMWGIVKTQHEKCPLDIEKFNTNITFPE